jgi:Mg-chelatase subunit ChlD
LSLAFLQDRLPESFEVLDVLNGCTLDHLDVFLRRAQTYTSYTFVLLNVDQLTGNLPEKLVSFVSARNMASSGINLHCVQRKPSLLHTGPSVAGANWNPESLTLELDKQDIRDDTWKKLILEPQLVDHVHIVWTPSSGTGKTRYIRKQLNELQNAGSEVATITIHEYSTISSLVGDLLNKFSPKEEHTAVHFNFCHLPDRSEATCSWLESVNRFFFSLLLLRSVCDPMSGRSFHLGERSWKIYVELPAGTMPADDALRMNMPVLEFCGSMHAPPIEFEVDQETRRVCTYLRALRDGTINRKFVASRGRQIIFVLDSSGSMQLEMGDSTALSVATDNALRLFDSHVNVGDVVGLTMFNDVTSVVIPPHAVIDEANKAELRMRVDNVRHIAEGGTEMYDALFETVASAENQADMDTWIVCLTDGCSDTMSYELLQQRLQQSSDKLRILLIGINLPAQYEHNMRELCGKYRGCSTGCFVPSTGTLSALNAAFAAVASRIPVSQTFELFDGVLSDDECRNFLRDYTRPFLAADDMLMQTFFVRFLYRRVKVFDMNTDFNENVHYDDLGRTLMETMLEEVKRLLAENQRRDWIGENHAQLVYDFSDANDPKFRLVCTSPDELSGDLRKRYEALDLPGFSIPTKDELSKRATLDRFLSQALGVPLHENEDGEPRLKCIDEHGFILTLDFTMKLLNMHERVACRVPCLIEGETGVSKTALTKMYSILRNSALQYEGKDSTELDISSIERELDKKGFSLSSGHTPLLRLHETLASAAQKSIGDETEVAGALHELLMAKQGSRPALFRAIPDEFNLNSDSRTNTVRDFLDWFATALLEPTFFEVNVDASLTQEDVVLKFLAIRTVARKLLSTDALVVVFLDGKCILASLSTIHPLLYDRPVPYTRCFLFHYNRNQYDFYNGRFQRSRRRPHAHWRSAGGKYCRCCGVQSV